MVHGWVVEGIKHSLYKGLCCEVALKQAIAIMNIAGIAYESLFLTGAMRRRRGDGVSYLKFFVAVGPFDGFFAMVIFCTMMMGLNSFEGVG